MSGHSKWSSIKRQKAITDGKRGNLFTKLANAIALAAKQGGADTTINFKLRLAVDRAKNFNMPNNNIDRAIKRGTGELAGETIDEITYEAYGPQGIAMIIQATTNNKNRTSSDIKSTLSKHGGNLGSSGCVMWMFDQKGVIRILKENFKEKDEFELQLIDAGADDIIEEEEGYTIYTPVNKFPDVNKFINNQNIKSETAEIEFIPQNKVSIAKEKIKIKLDKLLAELENNDDVNNYFTNADL